MSEPTFQRTNHLVALVAEAERLATALAGLAPDAAVAEDLRAAAAVATLRLDGSTLTAPPDRAVLDDVASSAAVPAERAGRGSWLDALSSYVDDDASDTHVWALEYLGARAGLAADDLVEPLRTDPVDTLAALHRRLTRGLVADEYVGRLRRSDQAVQDGSVGRVLYYPTAPDAIARGLHLLGSWLTSAGAREHGVIASGVLHLELLRLHPYESANGRLARTAARLLLRGRGLDPHGLAVAELALAEDALGTYDEVARTLRRRDLTIWLERWGEAVSAGLRRAARELGLSTATVPERAAAFVARRIGEDFTVADYRAEVGVGPEELRADLEALLDAAAVTRVLGSRGLRLRAHAAVPTA